MLYIYVDEYKCFLISTFILGTIRKYHLETAYNEFGIEQCNGGICEYKSTRSHTCSSKIWSN